MSTRCGCADEGDDIVFGPVHWCTTDASVRGRHAQFGDAVHQANQRVVVSPAVETSFEPRYMETLDEDERRGD